MSVRSADAAQSLYCTLIPGCGAANADLVTTTDLWRLYTCHQPATEVACMSMDDPQRSTGEDLVSAFYVDSRILPDPLCHYFLGGCADKINLNGRGNHCLERYRGSIIVFGCNTSSHL